MKKIYLRLLPNEQLDYLIENDLGAIETGSAFHPDQYPHFPANYNVILLVPGEGVTLVSLTLPSLSRNELLKSIPFALEEELLDDIVDLYFFAGAQQSDGRVTVAISKKTWLDEWIRRCEQWQLVPHVVLPDYLALSSVQNAWHIYLDRDRALVRQSEDAGFSVELTELNHFLSLQLSQELLSRPSQIVIDYDDGNEHFTADDLPDVTVPIALSSSHDYCMDVFRRSVVKKTDINLLPSHVRQARSKTPQRFWRWALIAFAVCAVMWTMTQITQIVVLTSRLHQAQEQVNQLYKQAFPQATAIDNPQLQIQKALIAQEKLANGGTFLNLLLRSSTILLQQNIEINTINFQTDTLVFDINANSFQQLSSTVTALRQQGMQVEQNNAISTANRISAQLSIKEIDHV